MIEFAATLYAIERLLEWGMFAFFVALLGVAGAVYLLDGRKRTRKAK